MVTLLYLFWLIFAIIELLYIELISFFTKLSQRNEACNMVETQIIPLESIDISFDLLVLWKLMPDGTTQ